MDTRRANDSFIFSESKFKSSVSDNFLTAFAFTVHIPRERYFTGSSVVQAGFGAFAMAIQEPLKAVSVLYFPISQLLAYNFTMNYPYERFYEKFPPVATCSSYSK